MKHSSADTMTALDQAIFTADGAHTDEGILDALVWINEGVSEVLVARRWLTSNGDFKVYWSVSEELAAPFAAVCGEDPRGGSTAPRSGTDLWALFIVVTASNPRLRFQSFPSTNAKHALSTRKGPQFWRLPGVGFCVA